MSRRVVGVTLDNLDLLPKKCRRCVFWELAPHIREQAEDFGQTDVEKEAWVSSVLLEWGSCGRIVMCGDVPAGYALYA
ncbi:MAG: GNAT family N-acetyltransferase, partial [Pseudonocardiaceae bacterium]